MSKTKPKNIPGRVLGKYKHKDLILFSILFATIAVAVLIIVRAAGPTASIEPENATITSPAASCTDSSASGGGCVQFKKAATGGPACTIFTSPTGTGNGSSSSSPTSLNNGLSMSSAGSVVCLDGTYNQLVTVSKSGTSNNKITIRPTPGKTATIDGNGIARTKTQDLFSISGDNVDIMGLEIIRSVGRGITLAAGSQNSSIRSTNVHNIQYNGILDAGADNLIDGNEVWDTVLSNKDNAIGRQNVGSGSPYGSQWAEAINTYLSTNTTMTNNYVHHNWGEGIDYIGSTGGLAQGNIVEYNFSVNIYIDGSSNVTVRGNKTAGRIRTTPPGMAITDKPLTDILVASEGGGGISGNIVTGNFFRTAGIESGYQSTTNINTWNVPGSSVTISNNWRNCDANYASCTAF